jgi:multidrug transporter EmrE-like cation transporter
MADGHRPTSGGAGLVSPSVQLGLLLALATALTSIVGFLYKHRGAVASPPVTLRRPIGSSLALFRSRWYTLGILVAVGSWGLHVAALRLAPISLVQATIAGGLVLLTVVADRLFGFRITRREWVGVALVAAGLVFLTLTLEGGARSAHGDYGATRLALYVGAAGGLGLAAAAAARVRPAHGSTLLAAAAGLLWGASDVSIKALSGRLDNGLAVLAHPLAAVILVASVIALGISARSLQTGPAVPVIAVTSAAANITTIAAGSAVFGEPAPEDPLALVVRILAFALVIVAAALTPAPLAVTAPAVEGK